MTVDHVGICPADLAASLRFYTEGIGLAVLSDTWLDIDLEPLLGVRTTRVRTVFLGVAEQPEGARIELLDLGEAQPSGQPPDPRPRRGLFLVSFRVPVEPALARLELLGLGGTPRRMPTPAGGLAAGVVDPDGTVVELLDQPVSFGRRA